MKGKKILTILVTALGMMVWLAPNVHGAQYMTVNGKPLDSITLEVGQSCTIEVVSDNNTPYMGRVGFDNGAVLGTFSHLETKPEAGNYAGVIEQGETVIYGYRIFAWGKQTPPSVGIHFVFKYVAQQAGETDVKFYEGRSTSTIDSIHITVMPSLRLYCYKGPYGSIKLKVGQSCNIEVLSQSHGSYEALIGFDEGQAYGTFSHQSTGGRAGDRATVSEHDEPDFYGYHVKADGSPLKRPVPGSHFTFKYVAQEKVGEDLKLYAYGEEVDSFYIRVINIAPVADAGADQVVNLGDMVTLDGRGARDSDGDELTYKWSFASLAPGSAATFDNRTSVNPTFTADVVGFYVISLVVNDGSVDSKTDTVTVKVVEPMGTAFTYQGPLMDTNEPSDGRYDFTFKLFDDPRAGMQQGSTIDINDLDVIDGHFTVKLDFGDEVFGGDARWLESGVRPDDSNDPNAFVTLSPRVELTPTPYAIYAKTASEVEGGIGIGGSGTANYIAKFADANTLGDSVIYESAGNVGIGTTSPGAKLDVRGHIITGVDGSGGALILAAVDAGNEGGEINWRGASSYDDWFQDVCMNKMRFFTNSENNNQVEIYNHGTGAAGLYVEGNVGIGTTSPQNKLEVNGYTVVGSNSKGVRMRNDGELVDIESLGTALAINYQNGRNTVMNVVSGKVGIGTTRPDEKLTVNGTIKSTTSGGYAVYGETTGTYGRGVYGSASNTGGVTNYGGRFESAGSNGIGVGGWAFNAESGTNYGGYFRAAGKYGRGIYASGGPEGYAAEFCGNVIIKNRSGAATVMELGEGLDYAEGFDVTEEVDIEAGTVLVIDSDNPGKLTTSEKPYDSKVAGIVAGAKGQGSGVRLGSDEFDYDVALAGRVYCNVDATETGVEPGDLLTTSATPGYAMKATDYMRAQGAILGKAMEKLEKGKKGQILVLVTLQ